jgi:amino acid transporter
MSVTRILFGRRLATSESDKQLIGPWIGVPVLGLDALASAAYGPEAMLTVLLPLGASAVDHSVLLALAIVAVLLLVFFSYRQTISVYPSGGGAYTVAKENLGDRCALVAAAALAVDYVLNVAVAIAAGVGALVSIVPALLSHTLAVCLVLLLLLTLLNLRGVRATGLVFATPTWLFVVSLLSVLAYGVAKVWMHGGQAQPVAAPPPLSAASQLATPWLLLHAFASGCTAMTGVEAVSNAVPIFRPPTVPNARRTLTMIVVILVCLLLLEATLAHAYHVGATEPGKPGFQSLLSQLMAAVVGRGPLYNVTMYSVVAVLCLSANTSFADFPRVCRILAQDKWLPEAFAHRGRRLTFSYGIVVLSVLSGLLLVVFDGITDALIPLFAIGAFLAFTMSQAGMVAHGWRRRHEPGARHRLVLNALGTLATGATAVVILVAKLHKGAWISLLIIGLILLVFAGTRRHHAFIARITSTNASLELGPARPPIAVVPMRRWDAVSLKAVRLALRMAPDVICVQVLTDDRTVDDLRNRWDLLVTRPAQRSAFKPPALVVLNSEYRSLFAPLLDYISELERKHPDRQIAVVVPDLVERRWYHALLHNHSASIIKALLLARGGPQIVVVSAPWYVRDWLPEHQQLVRAAE